MAKRGRKPTGSVHQLDDGRWKPRITLSDGYRQPLDPFPPDVDEQEARRRTAQWASIALEQGWRRGGVRSSLSSNETVAQWSQRWVAYRKARGLTSARDDEARLRDHIVSVIGTHFMSEVTEDQIRDVVCRLDDKVHADELAWKTAGHVWGLLRCMFKDACSSKRRELVVRKDNPTDRVAPPDRGDELSRTYLYPSEFVQLVSCRKIPVACRRRYVMAAYTLSRAGELSALRKDAVDLERGVIHFRQATDRRTKGAFKSTKTGKARRVPIELSLRPLLEVLMREPGDFVIHIPVSKRAEVLRQHLITAGVTRAELHPAPDGVAATWAPITFHDLRGTGVTWMALRGDDPLVIQQRAGHDDFTTTQRYLREAETLGSDGIDPFPPLPPDLLEENRFGKSVRDAGGRVEVAKKKGRKLERDTGLEPATPSLGS